MCLCVRARVYMCVRVREEVCMLTCVCVRVCVHSVSMKVRMYGSMPVCLVCVSVCLCVCPSDCLSVYLLACWFARMYTGMNESIILRMHAFIKSMHIAAFIPKHMRVCMKRTC